MEVMERKQRGLDLDIFKTFENRQNFEDEEKKNSSSVFFIIAGAALLGLVAGEF